MTDIAALIDLWFTSYDPTKIESKLITDHEAALGRTLAIGDPVRLHLSSIALAFVQLLFIVDDSAKQCMLKYARGSALDAIGYGSGVTRLATVASSVTVQFTLSIAPGVGNSVTIPAGTRITKAGTQLYWATDGDLVISDNASTGSITATCQSAGADSNGYSTGEIGTLVDPVAGVSAVSNTSATANGADIESDDNLRERIRLAPSAYSCAGSKDAYKFWARSASALISDVSIVTPSAGSVDIYVLLQNGVLPDAGLLATVLAVCSGDTVRPITDNVAAKAPDAVNFAVNVAYYISQDNAAMESEIKAAVEQAIVDYILWQQSAIGRDINQSELIHRIVAAGAKRAVVTSPTYAAVANTAVAQLNGEASITYIGLEVD